MKVAHRLSRLGLTELVRVRLRVEEMRSRGVRVLQLEGGEPFMTTPAAIKQAMHAAIDADRSHYPPPSGILELREAARAKLSRKNGIEAETNNIIVTPGAGHGLFCAFLATVDAGDEVVCFSPYWTPILDQVSFASGVPVTIPWSEIREESGPRETLATRIVQAVESRVTPRTRVIYLNSPANPTGDVLNREQLAAIASVAIKHDLTVVSDEAYEDLVYDSEHVSIASLPGMSERTISIFTLSKSYAMTGWRIGYMVVPPLWAESMHKLVVATIHGVSTPTQFAVAGAVGAEDESRIRQMRDAYRIRRDLLTSGLQAAGFHCRPSQGTFYAFPDVSRRLGSDSWKAMETLLERTAIAAVPGVVFGCEGEGHLRMSFSTSLETINEALRALKRL